MFSENEKNLLAALGFVATIHVEREPIETTTFGDPSKSYIYQTVVVGCLSGGGVSTTFLGTEEEIERKMLRMAVGELVDGR